MKEIVCPECGQVLEAGVATCPNCGCPIAAECPTVPCHYCGNMIADNATVCPKCGGHFETAPKCGVLRIKVQSATRRADEIAPLYVNGQLVEVVSLAKGCDISIPLTHPNITITYKCRIGTLERSYTLDTQQDYTLEIDNGVNTGFVLCDKANIISEDAMNMSWLLFCTLFSFIGLWLSYAYQHSQPVRSQYMRRLCWNIFIALLAVGGVCVGIGILL